ncbi:MAG: EFR1 family ferrodoxin [Lachnospiraceae bacterium]
MIFYFSSTGNDKYVATRIAGQTKDTLYDIADCLHRDALSYSLQEGENFGLVIPTYFGGFPEIVIRFLDRLQLAVSGKHYVFFVATYGANPGNICQEAKRRFQKLGLTPDALFEIRMVDNWTPVFNMNDRNYVTKAETEEKPAIADTVEKIATREKTSAPKAHLPALVQAVSTRMYHSAAHTNKFAVSDDCISCGLCARQCPTDTIRIEGGRPVWTKPVCTLCLGCVHRCPRHAISYTKQTIDHGQYFHPDVTPDRS